MRIGLYHGYELTGSGSNEYTRYLARSFIEAGHEVHLICREENPEEIPYVTHAYAWQPDGGVETLFALENEPAKCVLHQLPHGKIRPVYLTDKQRPGNVKSFVSLTDAELRAYHDLNERLLTKILAAHRLEVLHANHVIYQPVAALGACQATQTPLIIFPHGSAIEYTLKLDQRYKRLALESILGCTGLIIGNREVRDRILNIYPEHRETILAKTQLVGVGVDTSLFQPVDRARRRASIKELVATHGSGGKTPPQSAELFARLAAGDLQATRDYWDQYNHSLPDDDLNDHLQRIPWEQNILLFVGALTVGKGLQSIIAALPGVLAQHPQTHLVIVGAGAYREALEALVYAISSGNKSLLLELCAKGKDLDRNELTGPWEDVQYYLNNPAHLAFVLEQGRGLAEHVHFLGRLSHARLHFLFPCADLAIFPSVVPEAYPLVLMESLSNGVLPLVSYFSGFMDGVDDLIPFLGQSLTTRMKIPVDPAVRVVSIAPNINDLLTDASVKSLSPTLRQIAVENYDWALRAAQMVEAYEWLIRQADREKE
ncbi:MAG: glycosyltransferase family 4 protein [Anaerolineae bacterium]|nr:glycosyltransferase family 4 protein [Anaerolineae bacterium]